MIAPRAFRVALARAGLTQYELAGRARIPPQTLSAILHGRRPATPLVLRALERVLGLAEGGLEEPGPGGPRDLPHPPAAEPREASR